MSCDTFICVKKIRAVSCRGVGHMFQRKPIGARNMKWKKNINNSEEEGMVQYFYHSPSSRLPIKDVLNKQGHKTEPHIEIGAENFCAKCYQQNIKKFAEKKLKYLFLITTCKNDEVNKRYGKGTNQFVVGYIVKEKAFEIEGRTCVKGLTFIYSFDDSILTKELFGKNFSQSENKGKTLSLRRNVFVDKDKTKQILNHFHNRKNILNECINKIKGLDKNNETCKYGEKCKFRSECLRLK